MASTPVEFKAPSGLTLTLKLYPYGSDTIANGAGGDSCTERTNCKGIYTATVTEAITGLHDALVVDGSSNVIANYSVHMLDDTNIHRCGDVMIDQIIVDWTDGGRLDVLLDSATTMTVALTESYGTEGQPLTVAQFLYLLKARSG
jgi:hypothetical protein